MGNGAPVRPAPLEGAALKAALLDGLRLWALTTGEAVSGGMVDLVEHQMAAIRRSHQRTDAPDIRPSPQAGPSAQEPEPQPDEADAPRRWWLRD